MSMDVDKKPPSVDVCEDDLNEVEILLWYFSSDYRLLERIVTIGFGFWRGENKNN